MHVLRNFIRIQSTQTGVIILLSVGATYLCLRYNVAVELPTSLIGIAIVFPIVFSINAAYRRREEALRYFASLKAHAVALFYAHRDWLPENNNEHLSRARELIIRLLQAVRKGFIIPKEQEEDFQRVYQVFAEFSLSMEKLRTAGVSGSEISRANQYLRAMMIDFERMRNIFIYRTPTSLRAYSQVFINTFPVLFAPYFAYLSRESFFSLGFIVAAFYSLVLVSLDNIQERLENPFDEFGVDDVKLNVAEDYRKILISHLDESSEISR